MIFEKKSEWERKGEITGYLFSYLLFTSILYLIFSSLNKLPNGWNFLHLIGLTLFLVLIGTALKEWFK